jgi:hypothetical protein
MLFILICMDSNVHFARDHIPKVSSPFLVHRVDIGWGHILCSKHPYVGAILFCLESEGKPVGLRT